MAGLGGYVTGETLPDTHDERYRQALARLLVEHKGYGKDAIKPRQPLIVRAGDCRAVIRIDYVVTFSGRWPWSLNTVPVPLSRATDQPWLFHACWPLTKSPWPSPPMGKTQMFWKELPAGLSAGTGQLPEKSVLKELMKNASLEPISTERAQMESRVAYAYEVDGSCPCDDTICRL